MKRVFDQNLSPRLAVRLADLFPGSSHVHPNGLGQSDDRDVRTFALLEGFTLVTKDGDFSDLAAMLGVPPLVVWLRIGNCTTRQIEELIRRNHQAILQLDGHPDAGVLSIQ